MLYLNKILFLIFLGLLIFFVLLLLKPKIFNSKIIRLPEAFIATRKRILALAIITFVSFGVIWGNMSILSLTVKDKENVNAKSIPLVSAQIDFYALNKALMGLKVNKAGFHNNTADLVIVFNLADIDYKLYKDIVLERLCLNSNFNNNISFAGVRDIYLINQYYSEGFKLEGVQAFCGDAKSIDDEKLQATTLKLKSSDISPLK